MEPSSDDAAVLTFIAARDVACPSCSYNLRALTQPRCPECGEALRLKVTAVDPRLGAWLALTVFLALAAGMGCLFLVLFAKRGIPASRDPLAIRIAIWTSIACIPLAVAAVACRRPFNRLPNWIRHVLAYLAPLPLLTILLAVLFFK